MSYSEKDLSEDLRILVNLGLVEAYVNEYQHPAYRITEKAQQMTQDEITTLVLNYKNE